MAEHDTYMNRCLQLAVLGKGYVSPNPMVGAVLVHDNIIIGEGYHQRFGEAHAEAACLNSVAAASRHLIPKSTMYVSLEPCTHTGKTPPCADLLIREGIKKVVVGCKDPFEKVNGSGISKLRAAGIEVITNVLEEQSAFLNRRFFTFHQQQRPYIILKWAQSRDRKISSGPGRLHISNEYTNILVHKWRSEESAILVGTNTAISDDPSLTTRNWPGKSPLRVVIDRDLKLDPASVILTDTEPALIINTLRTAEEGNKAWYQTGKDEDMISVVLNVLHKRNVISLIVEGGAQLHRSFLQTGIWDEARVITNREMIVGSGTEAAKLPFASRLISSIESGSDLIEVFINTERR